MKTKQISIVLIPTTAKILIFIILFLLFVPVVEYDTGIRCITTPCPSGAPGSVLIYLMHFSHIYQFYYVSIVIGAVACYIIACLLWSLRKDFKK
jgi:hypothetical protein